MYSRLRVPVKSNMWCRRNFDDATHRRIPAHFGWSNHPALRGESLGVSLIMLGPVRTPVKAESLLNQLLEACPSLSREDVMTRIQVKKDKIGAGYLNDEGAIFLVAADEGVELNDSLSTESTIKELFVGAKDVTLNVRIMSVSPIREFTNRDGRPFKMRMMTVYDAGGTCTAKLWDTMVTEELLDSLEPGDAVRLTGAYIKSDISGVPVVNMGTDATIKSLDDLPDVPGIDSMAKDVGALTEADRDVAVRGKLDGMLNTMNFTNSRGEPGKALRMRLKGLNGESYRVVIWGQDDGGVPKMIPADSNITLLGVRAKRAGSGLEVHGNESTIVRTAGSDTIAPLKLRMLAKTKGDRGGNMMLCVDSQKNIFFVTDEAEHSGECQAGDVIECMPTKSYGKAVILSRDAYIRRIDDDPSIPSVGAMRTKLEHTNPGGDYCVEVTVLKDPVVRDIQTKSGETIQLLEIYACDDTGEAWIKGWRSQARLAESCQKGSVVSVTGVNARHGMEGRVDLVLTAYSTISPIDHPSMP